MPISEATYKRVALEDREGHWELHCGRLVEKPPVTTRHAQLIDKLYRRFAAQVSEAEYALRGEAGRLRRETGSYYEPDFCVVPIPFVEQNLRDHPTELEVYEQPLPLVVEVWSPSTGRYDVDTKLPEYQRRGDLEIWRLHPYEQTLTAWRRQPDGSYTETVFTGGVIRPIALPNVAIDLDALFRQP
jgi:Uma2 family endonuclease